MITIGITGGMGSGKSFICRKFQEYGVPIYDCDFETKKLLNENRDLKKQLIVKFGEKCYDEYGQWNKPEIMKLIKKDVLTLTKIEKIIEPFIINSIIDFKNRNNNCSMVIIESAILLKTNILKEVDEILIVQAPFETRMARIKERDPLRTDDEIKILLNNQTDLYTKQKAYSIFYNDDVNDVDVFVKEFIWKIKMNYE